MSFDLAIIGAGPGGYVAAIRASQLGAKVLLVERAEVGGVCLNRGCIPTKAMIASAHALATVRIAHEYGVQIPAGAASMDMRKVQERKRKIVEQLRQGIAQLLKGRGIELLKGNASLAGPGRIQISRGVIASEAKQAPEDSGQQGIASPAKGGLAMTPHTQESIEATNILIATGSTWIRLPGLEINNTNIVTTDDALDWDQVPGRLLIVGGGVIGCEFACMMQGFGSRVTIVEAMPSILPPVEAAISRLLARAMKSEGMEIFTNTTVERADISGAEVKVLLSNGKELAVDKLLVAVGRRPLTTGLNLDSSGIALTERGAIKVNEKFETTARGIYAIGDVIGQPMLAHAASAEGIAAVEGIFGKGCEYDPHAVPNPIFTMPEIGCVGFTSEELKQQGKEFLTGRFPYAASGKAICDGESEGQAIVHTDMEGRVLGAHIIGQNATLLIPEVALAMRKGLSAKDLEATIHAHPTLSEIVSEAAADVFGMAIHKLKQR